MSTTATDDGRWLLDAEAGPLVRPYGASKGRTDATYDLSLLSVVVATGQATDGWEPDQAHALELCRFPIEVAKVASLMQLPAVVTKVVLSDLIDAGAVTTRDTRLTTGPPTDTVLKEVLDGLYAL
ncbi:DUF742 domain-containing protein [Actinoallomurus sp. NBC_01490]|uniref:DUF742 domain-containing protein n=1 Tax=Actinoallomurus sp. NBC_01490 TaxID=2903557 RepID=UPI002E34D178|nr:DUF742 domain-containing protein [Actinoallomurus sp. NBC_01490]